MGHNLIVDAQGVVEHLVHLAGIEPATAEWYYPSASPMGLRRTLLTATLLGCLCSGFTSAREQEGRAQPAVADADAFTIADDDVRRILEDRVERMRKGVGIVVGLVDRAGIRVISHGTADRKNHQMVNGDSVFEIGSITKVFTAILLADMVEHGEVRLDDPISKYLPESVKAPTRNDREITLAHLATHMSGLPRMPGNFAPLWDLSGSFAGAGGLLSTANDLLKFATANLGLRPSCSHEHFRLSCASCRHADPAPHRP